MESSALHSLTKQKLLLAGKGSCVIPRRNPLEQLGSAPAHPHLPSRHSLLQPEHHFPGRDIQPRLRSQNPREFAASLLAEPFQRLHVPTPLVWKNRMEKETLGVSLMLMDFKAVRHLRGWDKEEGSRKSPSSAPYTQFRCRASPALSVAQSCVKPNYCPELSPPDFHNQKNASFIFHGAEIPISGWGFLVIPLALAAPAGTRLGGQGCLTLVPRLSFVQKVLKKLPPKKRSFGVVFHHLRLLREDLET